MLREHVKWSVFSTYYMLPIKKKDFIENTIHFLILVIFLNMHISMNELG